MRSHNVNNMLFWLVTFFLLSKSFSVKQLLALDHFRVNVGDVYHTPHEIFQILTLWFLYFYSSHYEGTHTTILPLFITY